MAAFAEHRVGSNTQFYDAHGKPYFRFVVDSNGCSELIALSDDSLDAEAMYVPYHCPVIV